MAEALITYLHDHLAGARFAINLLQDLSKQETDRETAQCAARLLPVIEEDRLSLEAFLKKLGDDGSAIKDMAGWIAQKAGRFKLDLKEQLGVFEAVETLSLGVLGKLALWEALKSAHQSIGGVDGLDLERLISRAKEQHQQLESLRLRLATSALTRRN